MGRFLGFATLIATLVGGGFTDAGAAVVAMTAADSAGSSSFNTAGKWSDGNVPTAGNTYETSYTLRTPASTGNYTFAGDSLTLNSGGQITFKGTGSGTDTITVSSLILNGGSIANSATSAWTLAGGILLQTTVGGVTTGGATTIAATISGIGKLNISSVTVTLTGNNLYSGGTSLNSATAALIVQSDGGLGTGNVTVNGGTLTLQSGVTNQYIATTGKLSLAASLAAGSINLNYTGTDQIAGLSFDGGSTWAASGTWGAAGSGATNISSLFTGTGVLTVVPEPAIWSYLLCGLGMLLYRGRKRGHSCT